MPCWKSKGEGMATACGSPFSIIRTLTPSAARRSLRPDSTALRILYLISFRIKDLSAWGGGVSAMIWRSGAAAGAGAGAGAGRGAGAIGVGASPLGAGSTRISGALGADGAAAAVVVAAAGDSATAASGRRETGAIGVFSPVFMRRVIRLMYSLAKFRSAGSPDVRMSMKRSMASVSSPFS